MARTRNIKPGFFKDEELVDLGFAAMILFAGLWTLADRDGRLEDRPRMIKAEVFPYTNINVEKLLCALHEHQFIIRYEVNGVKYIQVRTWKKHQNPNIKECASVIPAPTEHGASTVLAHNGHVSDTASIPLYLKPLTSKPLTDTQIDHEAEFERAWIRWPTKGRTRRPLCETSWAQLFVGCSDPQALVELIHSGIDKWLNSDNFAKGFIHGFADFLAQRRWLESPEPKHDRAELARRALE